VSVELQKTKDELIKAGKKINLVHRQLTKLYNSDLPHGLGGNVWVARQDLEDVRRHIDHSVASIIGGFFDGYYEDDGE
jgi:hypothetical protein